MIGKMVIVTALHGFNDLGHSVTPTFLSRNRFYLQLSTHCPKMDKVPETMIAKFELVLY